MRPACTGVKLGVDRAPLRLGPLAKDSHPRARSAPLTVDDLDTRVVCSPSSLFCQRCSVETMTRAGTRRRLALARLFPARLTRRFGQILLARLMRRCMGGNPRRRGGTGHREGRQCYSSGVGAATAAGGRRRRRSGGAAAARLLASVRTSSAPKGKSECPCRLLLYQYADTDLTAPRTSPRPITYGCTTVRVVVLAWHTTAVRTESHLPAPCTQQRAQGNFGMPMLRLYGCTTVRVIVSHVQGAYTTHTLVLIVE